MDSNFILNAIEAKHNRAPLLREISIEDTELIQRRYRQNSRYLEYYTKRGLIDTNFVPE